MWSRGNCWGENNLSELICKQLIRAYHVCKQVSQNRNIPTYFFPNGHTRARGGHQRDCGRSFEQQKLNRQDIANLVWSHQRWGLHPSACSQTLIWWLLHSQCSLILCSNFCYHLRRVTKYTEERCPTFKLRVYSFAMYNVVLSDLPGARNSGHKSTKILCTAFIPFPSLAQKSQICSLCT